MTDDPMALLAVAEEAARRAGDLIRGSGPGAVAVEATKSSPTDVVTATDRAAEDLLRDLLAQRRPDDGVLGEEDGWVPGASGLTWVVDPIDGTVNYLYGIPAFAVSVAVVSGRPDVVGGWETVAGCVYDVPLGQAFTAARGQGAWLDGRPLSRAPRPVPPLEGALVATGFGYRSERRRAQAGVLADLLPRMRDVRRVGCSALDLCGVAAGRYDAYFERGLHTWDFAAAYLVATESGVTVTGGAGRPPSEELLVAARDPLADVLAAELVALGADAG
ncbi:MAG TPA: inositol monophosphatase family protein [Kineosporiaceae bacterium]|nr:inositol monophosphatase family protein [Kineosporiaceae bacterium]